MEITDLGSGSSPSLSSGLVVAHGFTLLSVALEAGPGLEVLGPGGCQRDLPTWAEWG